jgi:hypothetical protein
MIPTIIPHDQITAFSQKQRIRSRCSARCCARTSALTATSTCGEVQRYHLSVLIERNIQTGSTISVVYRYRKAYKTPIYYYADNAEMGTDDVPPIYGAYQLIRFS